MAAVDVEVTGPGDEGAIDELENVFMSELNLLSKLNVDAIEGDGEVAFILEAYAPLEPIG